MSYTNQANILYTILVQLHMSHTDDGKQFALHVKDIYIYS